MDLNSWTPNDKARRLAVLLAVYLSLSAALALGLGLGWAWYLAVLAGVLLYTLARPSLQPGAGRLAALPPDALDAWAEALRAGGLEVRVSA